MRRSASQARTRAAVDSHAENPLFPTHESGTGPAYEFPAQLNHSSSHERKPSHESLFSFSSEPPFEAECVASSHTAPAQDSYHSLFSSETSPPDLNSDSHQSTAIGTEPNTVQNTGTKDAKSPSVSPLFGSNYSPSVTENDSFVKLDLQQQPQTPTLSASTALGSIPSFESESHPPLITSSSFSSSSRSSPLCTSNAVPRRTISTPIVHSSKPIEYKTGDSSQLSSCAVSEATELFSSHYNSDRPNRGELSMESNPLPAPTKLRPLVMKDSESGLFQSTSSKYTEEILKKEGNVIQATGHEDHQSDYIHNPNFEYKQSGNAIDVILIRNPDGTLRSTKWHVCFSWSRFKSTGAGDDVNVYVNNTRLRTKMKLHDRGRCLFPEGRSFPPCEDLNFLPLYFKSTVESAKDPTPVESNVIRFEHRRYDTIRYIEARLHVWDCNDSIIVADLDGTITINDVEGHIRTLRLGQYDFVHEGACEFFTKLHELGFRILYLTARPIDWAGLSREHLDKCEQNKQKLPKGPLVTNAGGLRTALVSEVVNKNPHVFKTECLNSIQLEMIHGGRTSEYPVFVCGFGNRPTDVVAYQAVGMDPDLIFLIDPYSQLKSSTQTEIYESYKDPRSLMYLLPKLKRLVPFNFVEKIDIYTAHAVVFADEIEQLRMAERRAKRLKEEELERQRQEALQRASSSRPPASSLYS